MCKPGEPCPGAEDGEGSDLNVYLGDMNDRVKAAFGPKMDSEILVQAVEANVLVESAFDLHAVNIRKEVGTKGYPDKMPTKADGSPDMDAIHDVIKSTLTALDETKTLAKNGRSVGASMLAGRIRMIRAELDEAGVPMEVRLANKFLLAELTAADPEFSGDKDEILNPTTERGKGFIHDWEVGVFQYYVTEKPNLTELVAKTKNDPRTQELREKMKVDIRKEIEEGIAGALARRRSTRGQGADQFTDS